MLSGARRKKKRGFAAGDNNGVGEHPSQMMIYRSKERGKMLPRWLLVAARRRRCLLPPPPPPGAMTRGKERRNRSKSRRHPTHSETQ